MARGLLATCQRIFLFVTWSTMAPCAALLCEEPAKVLVSGGHTLHVEIHGNCSGPSLLYFHGGWGPKLTDFRIVPSAYRIVYFHQRGWGLSEPMGSLQENGFDQVIKDAKLIRDKYAVSVDDRWAVFGLSNGATLALMYAARYPETVMGVVLSGYWAMTPSQLAWDYFGAGKPTIYPEEWQMACDKVGCTGSDILAKYHSRLSGPSGDDGCDGPDRPPACDLACSWLRWDALGAAIDLVPQDVCATTNPRGERNWYQMHPLAAARLGLDAYLQKHSLPDLRGLVTSLVNVHFVTGRFDGLCPPSFAAEAVKEAQKLGATSWKAEIVEHAAHSMADPGMNSALKRALGALIDGQPDGNRVIQM